MKSDVFFGHRCPRCRSSVGMSVALGGVGSCPGCGGPLIAGKGGPQMTSVANYTCPGCKSYFGMLSIVGGEAKCPQCQHPIE